MDSHSIISGIDAEIAKLQRVRSLLVNGGNVVGVANRKAAKKASAKHAKKRVLSPEARARIGDAQRKRWAASKKPESAAPAKATKKAAKKTSRVNAKIAAPKKVAKRTVSPEARKRMADAQRKRWATARKLNSSAPAKAAKRAAEKTAPVKATKPVTAVQETLKAESAS
jgi:hypothetical protein